MRRLAALPPAVAAVALAVTTACAGQDTAGGAPATPASSPARTTASPSAEAATRDGASTVPTAEPSASPSPALPPPAGADPAELAAGLEVPWGTAFLDAGTALVAERGTARILEVTVDGGARHVATVPGVVPDGEGGLLGLALDPAAAADGWVYAYLTAEDDNRIVRFRLDPASTDVRDLEVVLEGIRKAGIHNGGRLAFGPDGSLYAGTGDAAETGLSQDPDSLNGKVLRMTPEGEPAPGNPDPGSVVFSLGHRNVQGLAFDGTGRLWATEFGQNTTDEVNLIEAGRNYGWPEVEGEGDTDGGRFTNPRVTWPTSEASPSGAAIAPSAGGDVLYVAALRGQRLWRVPLGAEGAGEPEALFEGEYGRLRTVTLAPDGALWLSTSNTDSNGRPLEGDDRVLRLSPP